MRRNDINNVIRRAYGSRYNLDSYEIVSRRQHYLSRIRSVAGIINQKRVQTVTILLVVLISASTIYYYNLLVDTQQNVLAARGKVDALMQRRNDISINLSKAAYDYSKHEQGVFTAVVGLRAMLSDEKAKGQQPEEIVQKPDAPKMPGGVVEQGGGGALLSPLASLDRLLAVSEQYPDLKLSANFITLMTALIDVEKDLAAERIKYNEVANIYTTNLNKFPVNIFARIFEFETQPYFEATQEAKSLKPIEY